MFGPLLVWTITVRSSGAAFALGKFPDTADAELAALVGRPVQRLGWNTWFI